MIYIIKRKFIDQYLYYADIHTECTISGNYKKGNMASKKLFELNTILKNNFEEDKEIIDQLIESSNPGAFLWISNVALDLHYRTDEVVNTIRQISHNKDLGIISFGAEMQLKTRNLL